MASYHCRGHWGKQLRRLGVRFSRLIADSGSRRGGGQAAHGRVELATGQSSRDTDQKERRTDQNWGLRDREQGDMRQKKSVRILESESEEWRGRQEQGREIDRRTGLARSRTGAVDSSSIRISRTVTG